MPRGPKGQRRPADVIGNAIMVARIATGEITEETAVKSAAAQLGSLGGKARAENLTKKKRSEIARKAAKVRWRRAGPSGMVVKTMTGRQGRNPIPRMGSSVR